MTQAPYPPQVLSNRAVISIEGDDATAFLQSLVTNDVSNLKEAEAAYAALLTPQGKIHAEFFVVRTVDGFLLDCAANRRAGLLSKLGFYKLRSKVRIAPRDEVDVGVSHDASLPIAYVDPRLTELGKRLIVPKGSMPHAAGYDNWRLSLGVADSDELGEDRIFPHEANFDLLHGVDFAKGCYVGQEVVSRMQHRATVRSRILPLQFQGAAMPGVEIMAGEKPVGMVLAVSAQRGLALMRLDRLAEARDALLTAGVSTAVQIPAWMQGKIRIESEAT